MDHLIWIIYSSLLALTNLVSARFCEGGNGHRCLPPKECCQQGCCYLYSPPSAPRSPQQPTDHVLNLFFINHWYFWLFLFAIVIALLLICSLWKKRHTLFCTSWNTSSHRTPSEHDSAGSIYAPPHYSRCSSFYHAPPPYNEVTSKPDLYPLVFSYTNDGSKNGNNGAANYLMVQYFRNYIVRPLSATSTIDSLSSSFICTANEANTMIPPPYSTAASPDDDLSISLNNYAIPRSASQQGYASSNNNTHINNNNQLESQILTGKSSNIKSGGGGVNVSNINRPMSVPNTLLNSQFTKFRASESAHLFQLNNNNNSSNSNDSDIGNHNFQIPTSSNSNSTMTTTNTSGSSRNHNISISDDDDEEIFHQASEGASMGNIPNSSNGNQMSIYHSNDTMLSLSAAMIDKIAYSRQTNDHTKLDMIQKQLEKCCELIQQQQQQIQQTRSHFNIATSFDSASESPLSSDIAKKMSESAIIGLGYMNSNIGSTVSSLNLNSPPSSPPRATSPTQEVKDLLEQIRQLKDKTFSDEELNLNVKFDVEKENEKSNMKRVCAFSSEASAVVVASTSSNITPNKLFNTQAAASSTTNIKRPTSLSNKRRFFNMKNRSVYLPISSNNTFTTSPNGLNSKMRSPISASAANTFINKSRGIRNNGWRSAPTTPGNCILINDHSPLLNEHEEEDAENDANQNC